MVGYFGGFGCGEIWCSFDFKVLIVSCVVFGFFCSFYIEQFKIICYDIFKVLNELCYVLIFQGIVCFVFIIFCKYFLKFFFFNCKFLIMLLFNDIFKCFCIIVLCMFVRCFYLMLVMCYGGLLRLNIGKWECEMMIRIIFFFLVLCLVKEFIMCRLFLFLRKYFCYQDCYFNWGFVIRNERF